MLFTKNFMRSWINHLSNSDRYLHKAAKLVVRDLVLEYHCSIPIDNTPLICAASCTVSQANDIQVAVKKNPTLGFTFILQLTGVHGSQQFDRITKTKTVETILTSMTKDGIQSYIEYLLKQVDDEHSPTYVSPCSSIHLLSSVPCPRLSVMSYLTRCFGFSG